MPYPLGLWGFLQGKVRKRGSERVFFYPLIHSSNDCSSLGWAMLKQEPGASSNSPTWETGTQSLGRLLLLLQLYDKGARCEL